jgi:hypothetical protein
MVLWGRERLQVRDEQRDIFERRLLVLLEPEAEPTGGEDDAAPPLGRDGFVSLVRCIGREEGRASRPALPATRDVLAKPGA